MAEQIVSTEWLAEHLDAPDIVVVDGSWHMEETGRDGYGEYLECRIPGAVHFDIDEISDEKSDLPHMLPAAEKFTIRMRRKGIGDGQRVVVYDSYGNFSASRVWWMFKVFGHDDVVVLDGGLKKWLAEGRPVSDGPPRVRNERHFTARFQSMLVRDIDDMRTIAKTGASQIIDVRSPGRFAGEEKEPREGLRSGHMPGALNLHYSTLVNEDGTMKSRDELRALFEAAGVDLGKPAVTTCGSGVTAAIASLALDMLGHRNHPVYDGSWTEWGGLADTPIVTD
ncbi:MAG TPA: 3-mercaptopyruvate sulfurtransferase [Rhizobiales bacterium]|nr:3-mercaptopyruvate sulfurtransferase [Hyphomicrobiales bacterium]